MEAYATLVCIILVIVIFLIMCISTILKKLYIIFRNKFIKPYANMQELVRDIDASYSPAVLSYLMNQQIEPEKDFLATILNLYEKKVIDIEDIGDKKLIKEGKNTSENLGEDEKYVYDIVINDKTIDFNEWTAAVYREYFKYNFSRDISFKILTGIFSITTAVSIILLFIKLNNLMGQDMIGRWVWVTFSVIAAIMGAGIANAIVFAIFARAMLIWTNVLLTDNGKKEVKKWIRFKKFIQQYSSIEDAPIESTQIWGKYIPYAMALNINREYQNKDIRLFKKEEIENLKKYKEYNRYGISMKDFFR